MRCGAFSISNECDTPIAVPPTGGDPDAKKDGPIAPDGPGEPLVGEQQVAQDEKRSVVEEVSPVLQFR